MLQQFIEKCHQHEGSTYRLSHFINAYRAWLPDDHRPLWPRARILVELGRLGFQVAHDYKRVAHIVGLAPAHLSTADGQLV